MADSTADSPAANADALKREYNKILAELLSYGGGSRGRDETDGSSAGVLKAIDEANRIMNRLKKVESKKPETDTSSSSSPSPNVDVPKEFKCTLSKKIMIEPVIVASGEV